MSKITLQPNLAILNLMEEVVVEWYVMIGLFVKEVDPIGSDVGIKRIVFEFIFNQFISVCRLN